MGTAWLIRATTHSDLLIRAHQRSIKVVTIHNASIINAVGVCGLQLYNFGQVVSIPFFTARWRPESFYDKIHANDAMDLHTLCLLDIKVKEQSEENLFKGIRKYEPPRFMTANEAIEQLIEVESKRKQGVLVWDREIVVMARVGSESQQIVFGSIEELKHADFGKELHSIIIPSRKMHELERKVLKELYEYKKDLSIK